jgi:hypothetical protein
MLSIKCYVLVNALTGEVESAPISVSDYATVVTEIDFALLFRFSL